MIGVVSVVYDCFSKHVGDIRFPPLYPRLKSALKRTPRHPWLKAVSALPSGVLSQALLSRKLVDNRAKANTSTFYVILCASKVPGQCTRVNNVTCRKIHINTPRKPGDIRMLSRDDHIVSRYSPAARSMLIHAGKPGMYPGRCCTQQQQYLFPPPHDPYPSTYVGNLGMYPRCRTQLQQYP